MQLLLRAIVQPCDELVPVAPLLLYGRHVTIGQLLLQLPVQLLQLLQVLLVSGHSF